MAAGAVPVQPIDLGRLQALIGSERVGTVRAAARDLGKLLGTRRVLNVNSTAVGGGVAEMLVTLLGYARGLEVDARWLVIDGGPEFFEVTKRIHNGLYGSPGDGGELGTAERSIYERTTASNVDRVLEHVRRDDVVLVHDPQPAGLIAPLVAAGARVVWRCHVGYDGANEWTERAWSLMRPYVEPAHAYVFSQAGFAPEWVEPARLRVIPPSIDPFTPKNEDLEPHDVFRLLAAAGLVRDDGPRRRTRVGPLAEVLRAEESLSPDVRVVVQVSRWDRMKDMVGVLEGFVRHVDVDGARLVLAGPAVDGVPDDPESHDVWHETVDAWRALDAANRARVHLVAISMHDPVENARIVNALQRHAAVVAQKSIAEGFGLTVAEAMWKSRPVVASAVGGIVDQVRHDQTGLLVSDPHDLAAFGAAVQRLLQAPAEAEQLGLNARRYVAERFLADRPLLRYAELLTELLTAPL